MKKFRIYIAVLCTMLVAAACTNEMKTDTTATDVAQLVKIGHFPAFDETPQTRAIGTPDDGKTAWAAKDVVLLKIQLKNGETTEGAPFCYVLTYDGSTWKADKPLAFTLTDYRQKADITAYYAPAYEWSTTDGTLALKTGKTAGTDEYLVYNATGVLLTSVINIDFSAARTYSRLRVAAATGVQVTLTAAAFTAAGTTTALGAGTLTATTDAKGNAFFYGSWTKGATLKASIEGNTVTITITVTEASTDAKSYAIDLNVYTQYNEKGTGTAADPYLIMNETQLRDLATANNSVANSRAVSRAINNGCYFKLIYDITLAANENWTPIGTDTHPFTGHFDGNKKSVKCMNVTATDSPYNGFIGRMTAGELKDVTVTGTVNVTTTATTSIFAGGLVASLEGGTLSGALKSEVAVTASSNGSVYAGGLVGAKKPEVTVAPNASLSATGAVSATISGTPATGTELGAGSVIGNGTPQDNAGGTTGNVTATAPEGTAIVKDGVSNKVDIGVTLNPWNPVDGGNLGTE